jgi:hypothetical protein
MTQFIESIFNKKLEIQYNEKYIRTEKGNFTKIELKGKIRCPLLNCGISSIVCANLMDKPSWPRSIDTTCCKRCACYISLSIKKFKDKGRQ